MLKRLLLSCLMLITLAVSAQIKITDMPTHTGSPGTAWVPIVVSGTNKKVSAANFLIPAIKWTDTFSISTRGWRDKLKDSLGAVLNATSYRVKVSSGDNSADYLGSKLLDGWGITWSEVVDGSGNEFLSPVADSLKLTSWNRLYKAIDSVMNNPVTFAGLKTFSADYITVGGITEFGARSGFGGVAGTTTANAFGLMTNNTIRFYLNNAGHILANIDNTYDWGTDGANRVRSAYIATSLEIGSTTSNATLRIKGEDSKYSIHTQASTSSGVSYGFFLNAGTNSSDIAFHVNNAAGSSTYFDIRGDGQTTIGGNTIIGGTITATSQTGHQFGTILISGLGNISGTNTNLTLTTSNSSNKVIFGRNTQSSPNHTHEFSNFVPTLNSTNAAWTYTGTFSGGGVTSGTSVGRAINSAVGLSSSGTATVTLTNFNVIGEINTTTGTNKFRGFYHNPILTSTTGTENIGYQNVTGNNRLNTNGGNTSIGLDSTVSITARLHLGAGTASASTAPLKFTSGTNLTTPENGAMEYDGSNFYLTKGGVRYSISTGLSGSVVHDYPSTGALSTNYVDVTVTGAAVGDPVQIGLTNPQVGSSLYYAHVVSANTVRVYYENLSSGGAQDPPSSTIYIFIPK